jgi:hypothetical protein
MVRCTDCKKTFRQHIGKNWEEGKCHNCFVKSRTFDYDLPVPTLRMFHTPFDFYLDEYTIHEMRLLKY